MESPDAAGSSWSRGGGTEEPRVGVCGEGTEGSRARVLEDGTEGPPTAKSVGEARPPGGADPLVLRAVERLLDMGHEACFTMS